MSYQITPHKFLTADELTSLKQSLVGRTCRDSLLVELLLATGARVSELLPTTLADLDIAQQTIHIHGLKGSLDRVLPLRPALFNRLLLQAKLTAGKPFPIGYDRAVDIWQMYRPVKKKLHCLRHTFAIELYKKTRDIKLVQRALGHKSINNTMVYMDLVITTEDFRKAML
jgi:integrase